MNNMNKILIFANGESKLTSFDLEEILPVDKVICANGGTKIALKLGIIPHIVVGDLDSLTEDIEKKLTNHKVEWKIYPKEKDETDLELAVREALKFNPKSIYFVGLLGGRIDHTLANLFFLEKLKDLQIEPYILDRKLKIYIMKNEEEKELWGNKGDTLSLIPLSEKVEGIYLEGLKYPLNNETLYRNLTRGISNEFIEYKAKIKICSGTLIVIHLY